MIIGVDIDDTLTYLHDERIRVAEKFIADNHMPYKCINPDSRWISEVFDWTQEDFSKFWFSEIDNLLASVSPRPHAVEAMKNFKACGHRIVIVTARDNIWHKDAYKLSYDWLKHNDIIYDDLIVGKIDKTQACLDAKVDIFIDDMPSNLNKLQKVGIDTILMLNPDTVERDTYSGKIATNWLEVEELIKKCDSLT